MQDVARAAIALLDAPQDVMCGEAFNVGSHVQNYRIRQLAEVVHRRLPGCDVTFAEAAQTDPRSYRVDFSKFESAFPEFQFEWTPERGTDELVQAYEAAGLTFDDFEGHRYVRLRRLKGLLDAGELDDELRWTARAAPV